MATLGTIEEFSDPSGVEASHERARQGVENACSRRFGTAHLAPSLALRPAPPIPKSPRKAE